MGRFIDALKWVFVRLFTRIRSSRAKSSTKTVDSSIIQSANLPVIILPPPPSPSAPLMPDFEFRPSSDFVAAMGIDVQFTVINPLDLIIRGGRAVADNVLVVEASGPNTTRSIMWFRYDSAALAARGVSMCRMFVDDNSSEAENSSECARLDWIGVCGWVMDRSRF